MIELRLWVVQRSGMFLAITLFILMFGIYIGNHPAGLTVNVATTAANKGVLLALVAMAQTLPVLTGGLDLSVGMVFVLCNCLAPHVVIGKPFPVALRILAVLATRIAGRAVTRTSVGSVPL